MKLQIDRLLNTQFPRVIVLPHPMLIYLTCQVNLLVLLEVEKQMRGLHNSVQLFHS